MGNEHGEWIMRGIAKDDPRRIASVEALIDRVNEVGYLPLFANKITGFSVEEYTLAADWWSGDPARDPWEWREIIARSGKLAYGKFFGKKAGFISLAWLPYFANYRRDGYDFDARWDDGKTTWRSKKIMDLFPGDEEYFSFEAKERAGFGKGGEKNFEGIVSELQMQLYLVVRDFRRRVSRVGDEYGWAIALYTRPESIWGYDLLSSAYGEPPSVSGERILQDMRRRFPDATERQIRAMV